MTIVYKTSNTLNNRYYIGVHTRNDDRYLGSGTAIKLAVEKYGKKNFTRETLFEGTEEECLELEEFIVDEEFILNENNYNLTVGGGMPPKNYGNDFTKGRIIPLEERLRRSEGSMGINQGDDNGMRNPEYAKKQLDSRTKNMLEKTGGKIAHPSQQPEARKAVSKTAKKNIAEMFGRPIVKEIQSIVDERGLKLGRNWQRKRTDDLEEILRGISNGN